MTLLKSQRLPIPSQKFGCRTYSPSPLVVDFAMEEEAHLEAAMMVADLSSPSSVKPGSSGAQGSPTNQAGLSKYAQLLSVIEEMGRDIRPTYSGSRSSAERLKRGIVQARILVRDSGMPEIVKLTSLNTELNADAVEWCPISGLENLLACATYELVEDEEKCEDKLEQYRRGYIYLYELQQDLSLKEVSKTETPGILDCKWSRRRISGHVCLATVDAVGKLRLFKYLPETSTLVGLSSLSLSGDSKSLLLSLDWSNVLSSADDGCSIVVSDSSGSVHVVSITQDKLTLTSSRKAHEFEAWIAAYDYFNTSVFYSGGDDCKLKVHDTRVDLETAVRSSNEHRAGVTSIQSNWLQEHSLVTGSYDERILFWDTRTMKRPRADVASPGGVWRIKHDPFDCRLIACPCMYGGSVVVDSGLPTPSVIVTYDFHKNINYGIDWCWRDEETNASPVSNLLAVCSFYDKLLSLAYLSKDTP
ncbi:hypothetical protein GE061_007412 [Apolygus lucorum]|uniref:methylated diphthine methylhydrolase n=1 Tax=Apolygus lucorum TaxID=248454 RepID=A0A6A4J6N6_APOLU|nr:hypothetical protein GE061_007412 [Apolygus lucorum]